LRPASSSATTTAASSSPTTFSANSPSSGFAPSPGLRPRARRQRLRRALHPDAQGEPALVRRFETIEQLRQALHAFKDTYNRTWIIERHGYRTPAQVRADQIGLAQAA
jgi:hypothetical protein